MSEPNIIKVKCKKFKKFDLKAHLAYLDNENSSDKENYNKNCLIESTKSNYPNVAKEDSGQMYVCKSPLVKIKNGSNSLKIKIKTNFLLEDEKENSKNHLKTNEFQKEMMKKNLLNEFDRLHSTENVNKVISKLVCDNKRVQDFSCQVSLCGCEIAKKPQNIETNTRVTESFSSCLIKNKNFHKDKKIPLKKKLRFKNFQGEKDIRGEKDFYLTSESSTSYIKFYENFREKDFNNEKADKNKSDKAINQISIRSKENDEKVLNLLNEEKNQENGDDSFEQYLKNLKKIPIKNKIRHNSDSFIVDGCEETDIEFEGEKEKREQNDSEISFGFYTPNIKRDISNTIKKFYSKKNIYNPISPNMEYIDKKFDKNFNFSIDKDKKRDSNEVDSEKNMINSLNHLTISSQTVKIAKEKINLKTGKEKQLSQHISLLKSFSLPHSQLEKAHPLVKKFLENFSIYKEELSSFLFSFYNSQVFSQKLTLDHPITWNKKLTKTSGYCVYLKKNDNNNNKSFRIELSEKVCDCAERLRDTLIHELCHAFVWVSYGKRDGHGRLWKMWALKANKSLPDLPPINRCHSYSIYSKFIYGCLSCSFRIGRHSKSIDISKQCCPHCFSSLQLYKNTKNGQLLPVETRTPSKFAVFIKQNYSSVKSEKIIKNSSKNQEIIEEPCHKNIMKILSEKYKREKMENHKIN